MSFLATPLPEHHRAPSHRRRHRSSCGIQRQLRHCYTILAQTTSADLVINQSRSTNVSTTPPGCTRWVQLPGSLYSPAQLGARLPASRRITQQNSSSLKQGGSKRDTLHLSQQPSLAVQPDVTLDRPYPRDGPFPTPMRALFEVSRQFRCTKQELYSPLSDVPLRGRKEHTSRFVILSMMAWKLVPEGS